MERSKFNGESRRAVLRFRCEPTCFRQRLDAELALGAASTTARLGTGLVVHRSVVRELDDVILDDHDPIGDTVDTDPDGQLLDDLDDVGDALTREIDPDGLDDVYCIRHPSPSRSRYLVSTSTAAAATAVPR
jgi:hypothetical protein